MKSEVLTTQELKLFPADAPCKSIFSFSKYLEARDKIVRLGSAALGAICVPNPAEYIFYRGFVTVALGGGASREKCFQKNAFIKEHCPAKMKFLAGGKNNK